MTDLLLTEHTVKITNTREAAENHGLKILVHGPAGAGKTRLASTSPDLEHTLILSAEAGLLSLREFEIDVSVIDSLDDLRAALMFLKGLKNKGGKQYTWVFVDSLSEIAEVVLSKEKEDNANGMRAYGEMADTMFKVIRGFRDLKGINVVITAKQQRVEDDGKLLYVPSLPGRQLSNGIAYMFDEVFAMRAAQKDGEIVRWVQTANDGTYEAKDRSGALDIAEKPDMAAIAAKIHNQPAAPQEKDA